MTRLSKASSIHIVVTIDMGWRSHDKPVSETVGPVFHDCGKSAWERKYEGWEASLPYLLILAARSGRVRIETRRRTCPALKHIKYNSTIDSITPVSHEEAYPGAHEPW
jgi:hypothetical protein